MKLFSILRSPSTRPAWEYRAHGIIWRLMPTEEGLLVGEDRNQIEHTVSFFCLDEQSGRPLWENVRFGEPWWISIETVHRSVVLLHEFARPDFPDPQKIIAIDLPTGKELWRHDEYKFMFAHQDCVYAMRELFETIAVYELDLHTGQTLRDLRDQPEYVNVLRDTAQAQQRASVDHPEPLVPEKCQYAQFISPHVDMDKLRGEVEVIETANHVIFGFHENVSMDPLKQQLDQHLKVVAKESGDIVFSDVIARNVKMPAPDLFFVHNKLLLFVKDQNRVTALSLIR